MVLDDEVEAVEDYGFFINSNARGAELNARVRSALVTQAGGRELFWLMRWRRWVGMGEVGGGRWWMPKT